MVFLEFIRVTVLQKYNKITTQKKITIKNSQKMSRLRKARMFSLTSPHNINQIQQQLQNKLVKKDCEKVISDSIREMEQIFLENKQLEQMIYDQKEKNRLVKEDYYSAQKRISQIQQLSNIVKKQTSLMVNKKQKLDEAITLNKILMMEKVLRLQRETQQMYKRRDQCQRIRQQKQMKDEQKKYITQKRLQKIRLQSLNSTFVIKQQIQNLRCNTMDMKRRQANQIKLAHERQKQRSAKIENFKRQRAKTNYKSKVQQLRKEIDDRQYELYNITVKQNREQIKQQITQKVTDEYLHSFFATQAVTQGTTL